MLLQEIIQFQNFELLARKAMEGFITGLHKSPFHGFSVEFAEHRHYNEGENIRHLDWKLLAKTDKKFLKQFQEETNLKCHLWIDVSGSMYFPKLNFDKLKFSVLSAGSLCYLLQQQRDAFNLNLFDEHELIWRSEIKSTSTHFHQSLIELSSYWEKSTFEGQKTSNSQMNFTELVSTVKKRSLVVIFSDLLWSPESNQLEHDFWQSLAMLKFMKCEVLLFHITHKSNEINLEFNTEVPIKFIDLENKEELKLQPAEIRSLYSKNQLDSMAAYEETCFSMGIEYFKADVSQPIEAVLQKFYVKRRKLN